jgi:hypothetical protein
VSPLLPDAADLRELARPWKLATFGISLAWLLYGALYYGIADWDVGVTLLMGGLTYVFAPWTVRLLFDAVRNRRRDSLLKIVVALAVAWFVVDGVYVIYHTIVGNRMFRIENFRASSAIYFLAGCFWLYRGSVRDFFQDVRSAARRV